MHYIYLLLVTFLNLPAYGSSDSSFNILVKPEALDGRKLDTETKQELASLAFNLINSRGSGQAYNPKIEGLVIQASVLAYDDGHLYPQGAKTEEFKVPVPYQLIIIPTLFNCTMAELCNKDFTDYKKMEASVDAMLKPIADHIISEHKGDSNLRIRILINVHESLFDLKIWQAIRDSASEALRNTMIMLGIYDHDHQSLVMRNSGEITTAGRKQNQNEHDLIRPADQYKVWLEPETQGRFKYLIIFGRVFIDQKFSIPDFITKSTNFMSVVSGVQGRYGGKAVGFIPLSASNTWKNTDGVSDLSVCKFHLLIKEPRGLSKVQARLIAATLILIVIGVIGFLCYVRYKRNINS